MVNKPAGLLAVPLERREDAPSVYDLLEEHLRSPASAGRSSFTASIATRPVWSSSPRTPRTQQAAESEQFKRREPERVYLAVVYGHPDPPSRHVARSLVWDERALIQKETHPRDPRGKEAVSEYRVLETFARASLIEVRLRDRQAQSDPHAGAAARPHARRRAALYVYGPESLRPIEFARQALHACGWRSATRRRPAAVSSSRRCRRISNALLTRLRRG